MGIKITWVTALYIPTKLYQSQFATGIDLVARTYHLSHECHPSNFIPHKVGKFEIVSIINWITITVTMIGINVLCTIIIII